MSHDTQACTLGAMLLFATFLPGCGNENEQKAKITGTVDTSKAGMDPTEAKRVGVTNPKDMQKGYPKPGEAAGSQNQRRGK